MHRLPLLAAGIGLLLSLNDHQEVRRFFRYFKIQTVALRYSCIRKITSRGITRGELLISIY
jgi:hypothetical protein